MRLTKYAIQHRMSVYFMILVICLAGTGVYVSLQRSRFPRSNFRS